METEQFPISVVYENCLQLSISYCMPPQTVLAYGFLTNTENAFSICFLLHLLSSLGLLILCFSQSHLQPQVSGKFPCISQANSSWFFNICIISIFMPIFLDVLPSLGSGVLTALLLGADLVSWMLGVNNEDVK